jgi:hypothetical protein
LLLRRPRRTSRSELNRVNDVLVANLNVNNYALEFIIVIELNLHNVVFGGLIAFDPNFEKNLNGTTASKVDFISCVLVMTGCHMLKLSLCSVQLAQSICIVQALRVRWLESKCRHNDVQLDPVVSIVQ